MRKTNLQKGITLIALIITIVILLILAVVAISAVQDSDIIAHAQNATDKYEDAQDKEKDMLEYYDSYLSGTVGKWKQEGATLTKINEDGTKTQLKIGDYVNYSEGSYTHTPDTTKGAGTSEVSGSTITGWTLGTSELATEDLKWRVLGINKKGEIELISDNPASDASKLYLANDEGYVNAETTYNEDGSVKELGTLDAYCNDLYGQGKDSKGNKLAIGARSLNVDDINKLTNYDPKTYSGYGYKWTYKYPTEEEVKDSNGLTNNMWYRTDKPDGKVVQDWANITDLSYKTFRLPNEEKAISSSNPGSKELESTYYYYNIASNLTTEDGFTEEEATTISNMIKKGTETTNIFQWLASRCVGCDSIHAYFTMRLVRDDNVGSNFLLHSCEYFCCYGYRVRPVVTLKSDIQIDTSDLTKDGSTEELAWEIK